MTNLKPNKYYYIKHKYPERTLEKQLAIAVEALEKYANGTDTTTETDEEGNKYEYEYPLTNDDGETAKQALKQIKELEK